MEEGRRGPDLAVPTPILPSSWPSLSTTKRGFQVHGIADSSWQPESRSAEQAAVPGSA